MVEIKSKTKNKYGDLSEQLIAYFLLIFLLVGLIITAGFVSLEYFKTREFIEQQLKMTEKTLGPPLARAIYEINKNGIKSAGKGIMSNPVILGVKIFDEKNKIIFSVDTGDIKSKQKNGSIFNKLIEYKFALEYQSEKIGAVIVYSGNEIIFRNLRDTLILTLLSLLFAMILLGGSIFIFSKKLFVKPIIMLSEQISSQDFKNLSRVNFSYKFNNQINYLKESYNKMIDSLNTSKQDAYKYMEMIKEKNKRLYQSHRELEDIINVIATEVKSSDRFLETAIVKTDEGKDLVVSGNNLANKMYNDMEEIQKKISELKTVTISFNSIMKATKKIDQIAVDSKLLAFNADIEAAHAGQYGMGFSIIASSMSELASLVKDLSFEITDLSESSLKVAKDTIVNSRISTEVGRKTAKDCRDSFFKLDSYFSTLFSIIDDVNESTKHLHTVVEENHDIFKDELKNTQEELVNDNQDKDSETA